MEAPEILVVVELGLSGAGELSPKHPELTTSLTDNTGMMGGAGGWTSGRDNPGPL